MKLGILGPIGQMRCGGSALLFLVAAMSSVGGVQALELPPVAWHGRLESQFRVNEPDKGERTTGQSYTAELIGSSYLWKPWFGNWRARMAFSKLLTDSERDSDATLFSGDGRMELAHRSRFPVELFFSVQDNRVDFDGEELGTQVRYSQVGVNHRYTNLGGDKSFQVLALHDEQEDFSLGSKDQANRLQLSGNLIKREHTLSASAFLNDRKASIGDLNQLDGQMTVNHGWRPDSLMSVDNTASFGFVDAHSDGGDARGHNARVSSRALWRAETMPLTARGEATLASQRLSGSQIGGRSIDEVKLDGSLTYTPIAGLQLGASARARSFYGDRESYSTRLQLSADYLSRIFRLGDFGYTWNATIAASNETDSGQGPSQVYLAGLGHDVNRTWNLDWTQPVTFTFNAGQRISQEEDTLEGPLTRWEHRASINASTSLAGGNSYLHLLGSDTRERGRRDTGLTLFTFTGLHTHWLSRYSRLHASYNLNWVYQATGPIEVEIAEEDLEFCFESDLLTEDFRCQDEIEGTRRRQSSSNVELTYSHGRLFGVPRLSLESRLRASAASLSLSDYDQEGGELLWDNRLYYTIGKLDVRLRGVIVQRKESGSGNKLLLLSISRWF